MDARAESWMREYLANGCTVEEAARWVALAEAQHPKHSPAWWRRVEYLAAEARLWRP